MLSIPIINGKSTAETRPVYLSELRRAGADRVFLFVPNPFGNKAELECEMTMLRENIAYYEAEGLEVGVWIGGLGHGGNLPEAKKDAAKGYTRIVGLSNGGTAEDSFCPLCPSFFAMYSDFVRRVADCGTKMLMIDDDLRLASHGGAVLGCACERHIALFNERAMSEGLTARRHTREELAELLFTGKATPLRTVWLDLMGDTLREFAAKLRSVVDEVNPTVRFGHCACLSTWDMDGVDSIELSRILAGGTRPFLRLIGAPYWAVYNSFNTTGLGSIIDIERMQLAWCGRVAPEMEVFTEGDAFPRPRYNVPSAYLEGFHQVIGAEGESEGILKYMIDYGFHPLYETGYIDRHTRLAPLRRELDAAFHGKETAGVYVHEVMHKLRDADCTGVSESEIFSRFTPASVNFANMTSLPISFRRTAYTHTALVFGENAKYLDENTAGLPLILDAAAAVILTERGMDVGLAAAEPMDAPTAEVFSDWHDAIPLGTGGRFYRMTPADGAEILSTYTTGDPAAYTYENRDGLRVLVYAFEAEGLNMLSPLMRSYPRQDQMFRAVEWMQGAPLPAEVRKEPGAYVLCRRSEGAMAVGIWNFGADYVLPGRIRLGETFGSAVGIGGTTVTLDGDAAVVDDMVYPGGFAGFILKK